MKSWKIALLAGVCALAAVSLARADDYVDMATKAAKAATARVDKWDGPTTGPKPPPKARRSCSSRET